MSSIYLEIRCQKTLNWCTDRCCISSFGQRNYIDRFFLCFAQKRRGQRTNGLMPSVDRATEFDLHSWKWNRNSIGCKSIGRDWLQLSFRSCLPSKLCWWPPDPMRSGGNRTAFSLVIDLQSLRPFNFPSKFWIRKFTRMHYSIWVASRRSWTLPLRAGTSTAPGAWIWKLHS